MDVMLFGWIVNTNTISSYIGDSDLADFFDKVFSHNLVVGSTTVDGDQLYLGVDMTEMCHNSVIFQIDLNDLVGSWSQDIVEILDGFAPGLIDSAPSLYLFHTEAR